MLDDKLRAYKDQLLSPVASLMGRTSPNTLTVMALLVGLAAAGLAAGQMYLWAFLFWLASRILDGLDGLVARLHDQQSDFGGYLDIVADFVVYAAVPIGLFLGRPTSGLGISLALLLGSFYVNGASWMYLSAILEKRSAGASARGELTTVTMQAGLIGGAETILFYCAFCIWPSALHWLFPLMAALVTFGIFQRLWWARRHLSDPHPRQLGSGQRTASPQGSSSRIGEKSSAPAFEI